MAGHLPPTVLASANLLPLRKPVNSFLFSTVDKTNHMPVIVSFSVYILFKILWVFLAALDAS